MTLPAESRLAELEAVIEKGLPMFVEVGEALAEIHDSKLNNEAYASFDSYCRERWGFSRQRAYQLIAREAAAAGTFVNRG